MCGWLDTVRNECNRLLAGGSLHGSLMGDLIDGCVVVGTRSRLRGAAAQ